MSVTYSVPNVLWSLDIAEDFDGSQRAPLDFTRPLAERSLQAGVPSILGVDLSHYNADGACDFAAIKASGVEFVIYKCGESDWYTDPTFDPSWRAADGEGLVVFPYFFFRGNKTGEVQHSRLMTSIDAYLNYFDGYGAVAVDVETVDGVDKDTRASRFFDLCRRIRGESLLDGSYCSPGLVSTLFPLNDTRWKELCFHWVAHWTSASTYTLPNGWDAGKVKVWQFGIYPTYSWCPPVQGGGSAVDVNRGFFQTADEMRAWLGQDGGVVPPPVEYPYLVRVSQELNTIVREYPGSGKYQGIVQMGDLLGVYERGEATDGAVWLRIGEGRWVREGHTVVV